MSQSFLAHGLTAEQLAEFDTNGYLFVPDFVPEPECDRLMRRAHELLQEFDPTKHTPTIFKSKDTDKPSDRELLHPTHPDALPADTVITPPISGVITQDDTPPADQESYFLNSADKISYFLEEHAMGEKGEMLVPKEQAINKIAHALHVLDPVFAEFSAHDRIKAVSKSLGFKAPIILQSMVIFKQPRIGGKVSKHRDNTFLTTDPATATGLWFALEDCTTDNGCLWFVPGSHKDGATPKRFIRNGVVNSTINQTHLRGDIPTESAWPDGPNNCAVTLSMIGTDNKQYADDEFVPAQVKKGTLVLIHGDTVHMSAHNHSDRSRNIYTFHVVESLNTKFPATTWLQSSRPFPHLLSREEEDELIKGVGGQSGGE